jgi:hypothetical protein
VGKSNCAAARTVVSLLVFSSGMGKTMHACMAGMGPELRIWLGCLTPGAPACSVSTFQNTLRRGTELSARVK